MSGFILSNSLECTVFGRSEQLSEALYIPWNELYLIKRICFQYGLRIPCGNACVGKLQIVLL